jgi:hypothetical protein
MSTEPAVSMRSWSAGRYTCTLTMRRPRPGDVVQTAIEWRPEQPRRLTDVEIVEYRAGRNKALAEMSRELGINTTVIDL